MLKRSIAAVIVAAALGIAGSAQARHQEADPQTPESGGGMKGDTDKGSMNKGDTEKGSMDKDMDKSKEGMKSPFDMEAAKQFVLVDFYLTDAVNITKALTAFSEQAPGKMDKAIMDEAKTDLNNAINKALLHANVVHAMAISTDLKSQTDTLIRDLKDSQASVRKVNATKLADLSKSLEGISTHLMAADDAFKQISSTAGFTRLDTMNLSSQPVSGHEEDTTKEPKSPSPTPTSPSPSPQPSSPSPSGENKPY
jgi:hypothetical protein